MVGFYPNQIPDPVGLLGPQGLATLGDPYCVHLSWMWIPRGMSKCAGPDGPYSGRTGSLQRVLWSTQEVVQLRVLCSVGCLRASLRSSVSVTIPIRTSHRPLGTTYVCGDILLVHGNGWRNWLPGRGWGQTAELVVKVCGLSSHRLLVMSLRGSHLHSCLWMLLGATLALGQGQGKGQCPHCLQEEPCCKPLTFHNRHFLTD